MVRLMGKSFMAVCGAAADVLMYYNSFCNKGST